MNTVRFMLITCSPLQQVELPEEFRRWPVKAFQWHVADVAEILAADRSRVETGSRQVAVPGKETRRLAMRGRGTRGVADVIADAGLLARIECDEPLAEAVGRFRIEPEEAGEHERAVAPAIRIRRAQPLIDEIDDADA